MARTCAPRTLGRFSLLLCTPGFGTFRTASKRSNVEQLVSATTDSESMCPAVRLADSCRLHVAAAIAVAAKCRATDL